MRNNESFIYSSALIACHRTAAPVVFELICNGNGPADLKFYLTMMCRRDVLMVEIPAGKDLGAHSSFMAC